MIEELVGLLVIFVLAMFVGFEVITKVPPTLHTPLMSGSNAISGITIIGALVVAGQGQRGVASILGLIAVIWCVRRTCVSYCGFIVLMTRLTCASTLGTLLP